MSSPDPTLDPEFVDDVDETVADMEQGDVDEDATDEEYTELQGDLGSWGNIPEGAEIRDEEWADDDPADVPREDGGEMAGLDTDDDGVIDTYLPEGTHLVERDER